MPDRLEMKLKVPPVRPTSRRGARDEINDQPMLATPLVIGYLAEGGNFAPGLVYVAAVAIIGALAYILMIGKLERVE